MSSSKPGALPPHGAASGGAGKPGSAYSRFIPREELGSFAAWNLDTLHDDMAVPPEPAPAPAATAESAQALAAARQGGYEDGYRDGLIALDNFKQSFARQMTAQIGQLLHAFDEQIALQEQHMAQAVAQAAVLLARRVVRAELHAHPEQVAQAAQQAIDAVLLSARHIRVTVHPDDHALVAEGAAEALAARGARLLADVAVERGGCIVESDLGQIDARMQSRWRCAAEVLGSELPWRDGGAGDETP